MANEAGTGGAPLTALRAATSLATASFDESPAYSTHTVATVTSTASSNAFHLKYALQKIKEGNDYEKSEMQRLNHQLHSYLENVKMLESLNKSLIVEVDKAKAARSAQPAFTQDNELNIDLETVRSKVSLFYNYN
jgi:hypothetical protein